MLAYGQAFFGHFDFRSNARSVAEHVVSFTRGSKKYSDFVAYLETEWARMHQPIMHDDGSVISEATKTSSECQRAGICVCSGDGLELKQFTSRWSSFLKKAFPKGELRELLDEADVVCGLACETVDGRPEAFWWHLGYCRWSPYNVAMQKLQYVGVHEGGSELKAIRPVFLFATCPPSLWFRACVVWIGFFDSYL